MIRGDGVVEDLELVSLSGLKKPIDPILPVAGKFEEKLPLMAPVGNVPDMPWILSAGKGIGSDASFQKTQP